MANKGISTEIIIGNIGVPKFQINFRVVDNFSIQLIDIKNKIDKMESESNTEDIDYIDVTNEKKLLN